MQVKKNHSTRDGFGVCEKYVIEEKIAGIHDDFLHSVVR